MPSLPERTRRNSASPGRGRALGRELHRAVVPASRAPGGRSQLDRLRLAAGRQPERLQRPCREHLGDRIAAPGARSVTAHALEVDVHGRPTSSLRQQNSTVGSQESALPIAAATIHKATMPTPIHRRTFACVRLAGVDRPMRPATIPTTPQRNTVATSRAMKAPALHSSPAAGAAGGAGGLTRRGGRGRDRRLGGGGSRPAEEVAAPAAAGTGAGPEVVRICAARRRVPIGADARGSRRSPSRPRR